MSRVALVPDDMARPARCVVLVIDKQRWYLDASVSPFVARADAHLVEREVAAHDRFIDSARALRVPIVWTQMTEGDVHAPDNVLARWRNRPTEPRLRRADTGFNFAGAEPPSGDRVFEKVYPDATSAEGLVEHIRRINRSTVVLIGSYAARCVLATAFGAQTHGFHVIVPRGLAEPHPAHEHEEAVFLAVVASVIGYVVEPADLLETWDRSSQ